MAWKICGAHEETGINPIRNKPYQPFSTLVLINVTIPAGDSKLSWNRWLSTVNETTPSLAQYIPHRRNIYRKKHLAYIHFQCPFNVICHITSVILQFIGIFFRIIFKTFLLNFKHLPVFFFCHVLCIRWKNILKGIHSVSRFTT